MPATTTQQTTDTSEPTSAAELTNVHLAELISTERALLDQERQEYSAIEASLTEQLEAFKARFAQAVDEENQETTQLLDLGKSFDEVALNARAEQLSHAEAELEQKLSEYQALVVANNELAASVFSKFSGNIKKYQDVKLQIGQLKGKLDRFSQIVDACTGKK